LHLQSTVVGFEFKVSFFEFFFATTNLLSLIFFLGEKMAGLGFKVGFLEADFWDFVEGEFVGFEQGIKWERFGFEFSDNFD
jgi:hypothetical protein